MVQYMREGGPTARPRVADSPYGFNTQGAINRCLVTHPSQIDDTIAAIASYPWAQAEPPGVEIYLRSCSLRSDDMKKIGQALVDHPIASLVLEECQPDISDGWYERSRHISNAVAVVELLSATEDGITLSDTDRMGGVDPNAEYGRRTNLRRLEVISSRAFPNERLCVLGQIEYCVARVFYQSPLLTDLRLCVRAGEEDYLDWEFHFEKLVDERTGRTNLWSEPSLISREPFRYEVQRCGPGLVRT